MKKLPRVRGSPAEPERGLLFSDLLPLADEAAEEINRQAEDGQRELQRIADEADKAIRGTL